MPYALTADVSTHGEMATSALFGGNVLAPRATMTGEGSYAEAANGLGVTGMRYPGGSLTEYYFDISDPDQILATHAETGEQTQFIPLSDFMGHAADTGQSVTIVIPTRDQLSEGVDENGNRTPEIDEDVLRDFIHDVASGAYGDAQIAGFELGNEYWGSGEMNAVEYGRLAAQMSEIIRDELDTVSELYGLDTSEVRILAQMGHNYNYSNLSDAYAGWDSEDIIDDLLETYPDSGISYDNIRGNGDVNWSEINNAFVRMGFETEEQQDALDGIVAHVYSRGTESSRHYDLDVIKNTWLEQEGFENLEVHVTEWNAKSASGDEATENFGLHQAQEMLEIMEEFMAAGVDQAFVWPLIQNTSNALSTGFEYSGNTAPGEMFSMMSANLPGKTMIDFTPGSDRETEFETPDADVHAFAGGGGMVFYITSNSDEATVTDIDLSGLLLDIESMSITVLGMEDGALIGDTRSPATLEGRDPSEIYHDGILEADLNPGEIMQVVVGGVTPTEAFAPVFNSIGLADDHAPLDEADGLDDLLPLIPPEETDEEHSDGDDDDEGGSDDGGGWADVGLALALIPLALLGI